MKTLFLIIFCFIAFSCQENNKKESPQMPENLEVEKSVDELSDIGSRLCFLTTLGKTEIQNKTVQDSLILNLRITGVSVIGTFDWIPAEKDARKGSISAKKEGNIITGKYIFMQEGMKQTQPIRIELHEDFAKVTTYSGRAEEMVVEIEKVKCG